jgi:hypothetical protein
MSNTRVEKMIRRLTPAGRVFLTRLDKALRDEFDSLNNAGGDAIRAEIAKYHMRNFESVKSVNRLAESGRKSRSTAYYMIMNDAMMLLATDGRHRQKGALSPTGEQVLQIWRIYANRLVDMGEETRERVDAEEGRLLQKMEKAAREGGSLFRRIKAFFFAKNS